MVRSATRLRALSAGLRVVGSATAMATAMAAAMAMTGTTAAHAADTPEAERAIVDAQLNDAHSDPTRATGPGLYIVTLTDEPAAVYDGGIDGYPATRAREGERFNRARPAVKQYRQRLADQQDEVLARVGDPDVVYRFTTALNGFAAELTTEQVKQLRGSEGVVLVEKSTTQKLDTNESADFLDLTGPGGAWAGNGGTEEAGKGTVVGVIDSGIWPENPSFAGLPSRAPGKSRQLPWFRGACQGGEQWTDDDCNAKVVSARYFVKGFGDENISKSEYLSPRDGSGHGSHTASVAAGNSAVGVNIDGQDFGSASGMAPAASIAAYKACWVAPNPEDDGCTTPDTVAAVDQAVDDGVDVINYSISGSQDNFGDSVERAFLNAAAAGVFVATSAGNAGPEIGSVSHPSPWVTTVGASTHQLRQGAVRLGGDSYVGAMVSDEPVRSARIVLADEVATSSAAPEAAQRCEVGSLDAAQVQDAIVVCDRGVTARVEKSKAVARAGGAGMILVNREPNSLDADVHSVPTVHVDSATGSAIKAYVEEKGENAYASIDPTSSDDTAVPQVAGFSSRGPSAAAGGDLFKPDLTAPGVSVAAAVAPPSNSGRLWDLYSGTSSSAPHVAGLAAFVMGVKPTWTPAQIKSAMMTTAYDLEGNHGPFSEGAGHVSPADFLDPGLVYGADEDAWRSLLDGRTDASNVNVPSIAIGDLAGRRTVSRTVTNVSGAPETYDANVSGLNGIGVTVVPNQLLLQPGESATFRVRFETQPDAQLDTYAKGSLTWTGLTGHDVRIPVAVRPQLLAAPTEVAADGREGSVTVKGRSGSSSEIDLAAAGLVGALPAPVSLTPGAFDPASPQEDAHTLKTTIEVPEGTDITRFLMDAHRAADDLDMFVYLDDELVALSASGSADETVTLVEPEAGRYDVYISSFSAANGATTSGQLFTWVVGSGDTGTLELDEEQIDVGTGARYDYQASWDPTELDLTQRWFGAIRYGTSDHRTLVTVN